MSAAEKETAGSGWVPNFIEKKGLEVLNIFIDADGCPVKQEVYRVANRYGLKVFLVSNSRMRAPSEKWLEIVIVDRQFNASGAFYGIIKY
jgi:hypothetical protein